MRTIPADPSRLQQILGNLLSNAVKFTSVGGLVKVECESRDGAVQIVVSDNGEGIAPEVLPHVFEAFRQADGSITRRHGGLGLGLSIVQRLVHLHGGTVRAESAGLGRGSTFTVTLPAAGATASLFASSAPRDVVPTGSRLRGITVLAVDDNEDVLQLMQEMLQWEGASVHTATTAAGALELARKRRPDVLVLDIGMPDMNGYELLNALRAELAAGDEPLPAIAVTGYASAADARRAIAAGFQAHLAKPFEMAELFTLVEALAPPGVRRHG
jgi:CheY-like chemotaxis protein/anti-sigma regulatory factor (Ser/Thr protein kinase)